MAWLPTDPDDFAGPLTLFVMGVCFLALVWAVLS